jgi:hypothetical protein
VVNLLDLLHDAQIALGLDSGTLCADLRQAYHQLAQTYQEAMCAQEASFQERMDQMQREQ